MAAPPFVLITSPAGGAPVRARVAASWVARLVGLLTHDRLDDDAGLLLTPCAGVHTLGMSFPIDILFIAAGGAVLRTAPGVPPWRFVFAPRGTTRVLELAAGAATRRGWTTGTQLHFPHCP